MFSRSGLKAASIAVQAVRQQEHREVEALRMSLTVEIRRLVNILLSAMALIGARSQLSRIAGSVRTKSRAGATPRRSRHRRSPPALVQAAMPPSMCRADVSPLSWIDLVARAAFPTNDGGGHFCVAPMAHTCPVAGSEDLRVLNVGLSSVANAIVEAGGKASQIEWTPPAS